jgi:chromosome segregation ATPase
MGRSVSKHTIVFTTAALTLVVGLADAQTARTGGGNANAQMVQQMQQLASERTSLQADNAKLKKDLDDMRKERDALKSAQEALNRRAQSSEVLLKQAQAQGQAQHDATDRELAQTKEKMQELIAKFRETVQTMRTLETESAATQQTLAKRDQALKVCADRNVELYKINEEVLTHLEHQTLWTRVAETEPFTRIKRNQLENLVDDYKIRADEQRVTPDSSSQPAATPAAAPAAPH